MKQIFSLHGDGMDCCQSRQDHHRACERPSLALIIFYGHLAAGAARYLMSDFLFDVHACDGN